MSLDNTKDSSHTPNESHLVISVRNFHCAVVDLVEISVFAVCFLMSCICFQSGECVSKLSCIGWLISFICNMFSKCDDNTLDYGPQLNSA